MNTHGVVIWGHPARTSLIIWCADSQGLAYAHSHLAALPAEWAVGDVVDIDLASHTGSLRVCARVTLRKDRARAQGLGDQLRARAAARPGVAVFARDPAIARAIYPAAGDARAAANAPGCPASVPDAQGCGETGTR